MSIKFQNHPDSAKPAFCRFFFFHSWIMIVGLAVFGAASDIAPPPVQNTLIIIDRIIIEGNKHTRRETILAYLGLDSGSVFSQERLDSGIDALKKSELFEYVKGYGIRTGTGCLLFISVRENASFSLSEISGELFNRKYGQAESWWRGRVGVTKLNFRGANEALTIRVTFWDSRSIGFLWQKPFIATPYYMAFGAGLGTGPSTVDTTDNNFIYQSINFGRRFTKSTIYTRETTLYNRHTWKGSRDTSLQTQEKIRIKEKPYSEVFYTIGWNREGRDATFNAHRGIFSGVSATTTVIPADENNRYIELNSEIKFYHPGIFPRHTAAYYLHPSIRFGTGYIFEGKYIGGIGSLRAYSSDAFGSGVPFIYNNRVVFTYEYRFFLFRMPEMRFPWLAWYHRSLKNFNFHVDGAIFLDCGYLWKDWYNPLASGKESRAASGAGLGLRVMAPSMKRSVNLDFAWMVFPDPREYYKKPWLPFINLYLDLPF